ncbi:MAG: hypothetical protein H7Y42_00530 [Chitinophagaceae bacterium]|nr:hypothetical protein [Chitinophagaceae bacterium]
MVFKNGLLLLLLSCFFSVTSFSQSVTGIWKGYFIAENGEQYKLEFQVKEGETFSVKGVSYSYLDIRFYGKATMTGSFVKNSKKFRIKEIRTVEVKSTTGGGTCIMNYDLVYSRSGREEYLEGTYLGKQEVKGRENPYEWGDCGHGTVFLRRVQSSDFYVEPFLRKKDEELVTTRRDTTKAPPVVIRKPPVTTKTTTTSTVKTTPKGSDPGPKTTTKTKADSIAKVNVPVAKAPAKPVINTPLVLKERQNELMKSLVVNDPDVTVRLYDNGEIDDDTISIFYDKRLLVSNKRLSTSPITLKLKMDEEDTDHELVMVAENLGRIPPNTSLMIVEAGDQRFDVRITSTDQKNALVRFRYQKPKQP